MAPPSSLHARLRDYYSLAKPGIIYGNLITTIGGFLLGSSRSGYHAGIALLSATIAGLSLVVASGSAFNNYIDRDIDALMERTKERPLVEGRISGRVALIYAATLGILGFFVLAAFANWLATAAAAIGFFFYVFMYTLWTKRRSAYGTVVGSVAGAVPPVVGYCAGSGRLDGGALILFAILALWQMPHFFAIGIRRRAEYAAAHVPILPVRYGVRAAKIAIFLYIIAFAAATMSLSAFGYAGTGYFVAAFALSVIWLALAVRGFSARDDARWARTMFFSSLAVLFILFAVIAAGALL